MDYDLKFGEVFRFFEENSILDLFESDEENELDIVV